MIYKSEQKDFNEIYEIIKWAIGFYQNHGFRLLPEEEKNNLLRKYWRIPLRQIETSVVLASANYKAGKII